VFSVDKRFHEAYLKKCDAVKTCKLLSKAIQQNITIPDVPNIIALRDRLRNNVRRYRMVIANWRETKNIKVSSKRIRKLTFTFKNKGFTYAKNTLGVTF